MPKQGETRSHCEPSAGDKEQSPSPHPQHCSPTTSPHNSRITRDKHGRRTIPEWDKSTGAACAKAYTHPFVNLFTFTKSVSVEPLRKALGKCYSWGKELEGIIQ